MPQAFSCRRPGLFALVPVLLSVLVSCSSDSDGGGVEPPNPVATVTVTGPGAAVQVGQTLQLTATAKDAGGATVSGASFTWSSADQNIATVTSAGLVTGVAEGQTQITATTDAISGSLPITVSATTPPPPPPRLARTRRPCSRSSADSSFPPLSYRHRATPVCSCFSRPDPSGSSRTAYCSPRRSSSSRRESPASPGSRGCSVLPSRPTTRPAGASSCITTTTST